MNYGGFLEIFGTYHTKYQIFDNNVILTGANLSEDYFINWTDWYFIIKNCPDFANFLDKYS